MGHPNQNLDDQRAFAGAAGASKGLGGMGADLRSGEASRMGFVRKVYVTLLGGLGVGACGAFLGAQNAEALLSSGWFSAIGWFELIFFVATLLLRKVPVVNLLMFLGFNLSFGAFIGVFEPVLAAQGQGHVFWQAAGATVAIFGGLTAYVFATRKDFQFLGGMLFMTCWGLFFLGLMNMFFGWGLHASLGYQMIGLLMVSGFILFDTSNVLLHYDDDEYVAAALTLAWDFWYLMLKLIMIFMDRD